MKKERGQITIFIIIAVLIIAVVGLFLIFRGGIQKEKPATPETAQIKNFVQECLDESLEKVVFQVGENGGHYFPASAPAKTPILEVPYYIKNNKTLMPSKEKIEDEISKGVSRELVLCVGNFALFPEYQITNGKIISETKIESERVFIKVNYPLTIIKGERKSKIEDFNSEVPVRLGIVYDAVAEFINESIKVRGFCIDCSVSAFDETNLKLTITPYGEETYLIIIEDPLSEINKKEFIYIFANEYK